MKRRFLTAGLSVALGLLVTMLVLAQGITVPASGGMWTQVNVDGFGDMNNSMICAMEAGGGFIYAGTLNEITGAQLWRSADGVAWSAVFTNGFGYTQNTIVSLLGVVEI